MGITRIKHGPVAQVATVLEKGRLTRNKFEETLETRPSVDPAQDQDFHSFMGAICKDCVKRDVRMTADAFNRVIRTASIVAEALKLCDQNVDWLKVDEKLRSYVWERTREAMKKADMEDRLRRGDKKKGRRGK